ncbi:MAG: bifunctional phosphopantothenoylcysteine decarboxylase/phosphopantothenate--cysteine ligase CoaBC [Erysipelotrichaceae bacterium]|nr:bifunctional phosphopantothenoylcysteine decarboxylase/phosphopantothenate--cysteine ligase CoaBC [Erysipelotrichaceae bacterium]MDY5252069.1 bifunctional phosphopantothenoylcysteine decarboxylase/phosphopantothenate--cysteine ligase CoaBC [Erysipelotrichaceae bacterium]
MSKCVVIGVSGGIAAYKACEVVSALRKKDYEVHVIMTKNACEFVAPLTFETLSANRVSVDTFDRNFEYNVQHVSLAQKADVFAILPASANIIAKVANGLADDMLSTSFLACDCPKLICPAMNTKMLVNPITQDNIQKCQSYGMKILESDDGFLACGDVGKGRLAKVDTIVAAIEMLAAQQPSKGKKILISTGATREYLDPIRYITNPSSGITGREWAKAAYNLGYDVTLVCGQNSFDDLPFIKTYKVTSAKQMFEMIQKLHEDQDIIVMSAAVADFTCDQAQNKIKKDGEGLTLNLRPTQDILKYLGEHKKEGQILIGYAMETTDLIANAKQKLVKKNCDYIIANTIDAQNAGFKAADNQVTIISKAQVETWPKMAKSLIAKTLLAKIEGK